METAVELSPEAFPCRWKDCTKIYTDPELLYFHLTTDHVGRKATRNLCLTCHWEDCSVETIKRDHITSHLRVHIPLKPHHCQYCSKTFKRPQDLKKHEKTHTEEEIQQALASQHYLQPSPTGLQPLTPPRHPQSDKSSTPNIINQHSPLGYPISPPQSTYSEELLDSFSVQPNTSPYTDITDQFASGENALEFNADDFINLHDVAAGESGLANSNKRSRSSMDASDAINELFADVLQNKKFKTNDGLKPEYSPDVVNRLNTLSTFVDGIDSNAVNLNIQDGQDLLLFNEWIAQLSSSIGQGDDALGFQLNQSPLSNTGYQDTSLNVLADSTSSLGEAASYSAIFANSDMNYSGANNSPYDIDQDILSTSTGALYPTAGESQYVHSKTNDDHNAPLGYPSLSSSVGTVGQRHHYSNTPSIAPTYFAPNMNVSLNYGRSNQPEKLDYSTLAHKRTPRTDNSLKVQPEIEEDSLPTKEQVSHDRKKNVQTVLSQMAGQRQNSKPLSHRFTQFIHYIVPDQSEDKSNGTSREISPSQSPAYSDQASTSPYGGSRGHFFEDESDSNVDILTRNMDKVNLEDDLEHGKSGPSGTTSLYPTSPIDISESTSDIETRRKHLLLLQRLYELVSSKYAQVEHQSEDALTSSPPTVPAQ
ncbi:hypothetical protein BGW37DRAFT_478512 [Umbelopsis sp. PMI_123]|nr:hypothetical protein BGW37DRAFT_478512 [Umbelopsis sp. PMI_123]